MKRCRLFIIAVSLLTAFPVKGQEASLSASIIDAAELGTIGLDASLRLTKHLSLHSGGRYNPFEYESQSGEGLKFRKQRSVSAGARYWPWYVYSGWWMGGRIQYQEYSNTLNGSGSSIEGDRYGGGASAGYSYMLGKHFNFDMGLGFWLGYETYTAYSCPVCGNVDKIGARYFILPNDLTLSLTYLF